jgi:hypothetical protein
MIKTTFAKLRKKALKANYGAFLSLVLEAWRKMQYPKSREKFVETTPLYAAVGLQKYTIRKEVKNNLATYWLEYITFANSCLFAWSTHIKGENSDNNSKITIERLQTVRNLTSLSSRQYHNLPEVK